MKFDTTNTESKSITYNKAKEEVQKEEVTLVGFRIPNSAHKALKIKVLDNNTSIQELLESYVTSYLDNKVTKQQDCKVTI